MKKQLAFTVLVGAAATAGAQTNVQIYGLLDAGVTRVSGIRGGTVTQLSSGIMDGSRWGFKGNEDLGGGYRALFTMESRLETDTGSFSNRPISGSQLPDRLTTASLLGLPPSPILQAVLNGVSANIGSTVGVNLTNNVFDRQVYVGLVTPVGAILAGRQYTPAYELSAAFDIMNTQSALAAGQVASLPTGVDIRVSNALQYRIQQGPITASAMYALGEGSTTTGRLVGAMGMYKTDVFAVGAAYNTRKNERAEKSLTSAIVGASVNVGPGTFSTSYASIKDDHPTGLSSIAANLLADPRTAPIGAATAGLVQNAYITGFKQDARLFHVGYKMIFGPNTVYIAYTALNDKRPANADVTSYGAAYSYALSKRTDLNAIVARFNNKGLGQTAPGGTGYLGGVTASAGTDATSLAFGVRHRF